MGEFGARRTTDDGGTRVEVTGDLDAFGAAELGHVLRDAMLAGHHDVVVDLAGIDFVDASGIGVLARRWVGLSRDHLVHLSVAGANDRFWQLAACTGRTATFAAAPAASA